MRVHRLISKVRRCECGTSAIEYGLILAFIVLVMHVALQALAGQTVSMWTNVADKSSKAVTGK